jgi:hypothetical protein
MYAWPSCTGNRHVGALLDKGSPRHKGMILASLLQHFCHSSLCPVAHTNQQKKKRAPRKIRSRKFGWRNWFPRVPVAPRLSTDSLRAAWRGPAIAPRSVCSLALHGADCSTNPRGPQGENAGHMHKAQRFPDCADGRPHKHDSCLKEDKGRSSSCPLSTHTHTHTHISITHHGRYP